VAEQRGKVLNAMLAAADDEPQDALLEERRRKFISALGKSRKTQLSACRALLKVMLDQVSSLDQDRIFRAFIGAIGATLRTNFFQPGEEGQPHRYMSFKFDSAKIVELPEPRPWREIFVYSPRFEGIHLRGGTVARGGLRWSDRPEDFRTEVLGLMKAQMVKNTMIVPVGAKGGFVVKQLPVNESRDVQMAEVVSCYRNFIHGLLDITDNLVGNDLRPPPEVVRLDKDDPYLVVAADKGTATFSDIANSVSESHDFWMGDAFASGGSVGYDHKGMGITAKGAWESVKRHFTEMGANSQTEDFSVVGIGDMAGDVFGNGMLLSKHIRLKAAFNHLHIFLDPEPDAKSSYKERARMFKLERSAWTDYKQKLISKGGGVYSRADKQIPISPEVGAWLGIKAESLAPQALIKELLKAPVDLLWNGGIGTYVKASTETHNEVGDHANDDLRIDGNELRCKVIGEGGNLGFTQRGRIEFALKGGRVNTDFIDNSAGVDCSDHEVNIKILLNHALSEGQLTFEQRNELLSSMTDEVSELVLKSNYAQNQALSLMQAMTVSRLGSQGHFIRVMESRNLLDRELEKLPTTDELAERRAAGIGMTRPELATLLSYSKINLYQELLASNVAEDPYLSGELQRYFPEPLQAQFADAMQQHRLRREIIATAITNSTVNRMGATFCLRMHEDTGADSAQIAKAYTVAREVFSVREWWQQIESYDGRLDSKSQVELQLRIWNLLRQATRWIINHHRSELDIAALVKRYRYGIKQLTKRIPDFAPRSMGKQFARQQRYLEKAGFAKGLRIQMSGISTLNSALDIVDVAHDAGKGVIAVAEVYYQLDPLLRLSWLMNAIEQLAVEGQWHAHARGGLRDDLYRHQRALVAHVIAGSGKGKAEEIVKAWFARNARSLDYFLHMLTDMKSSGNMDYATVSVAVRGLEQLVAGVR
jgi:glutamate dehydrogenase